MAKKEMTWRELVTLKMKERRAKGEKPSLTDVAPEAQKDWKAIKDGTHPDYVQGKATFNKSKKSSTKMMKKGQMTRKNGKKKMMDSSAIPAEEIIANCKLCAKCSKKVRKVYGKKGTHSKPAAAAEEEEEEAEHVVPATGGSSTITDVVPSISQSQPASVTDSSQPSLLAEEAVTLHAGGKNKKKKGGCGSSPCVV